VLYGATLQKYFLTLATDARSPDIVIIPQHGVIYAKVGDQKKAEHGGFGANDTQVALLISNPNLQHAGETIKTSVFTTQVAPTTLQSLGISPDALDAVKKEGTVVLPGENW
jgi:arylsulfatase A-like enzyme